MNTLPVGIEPLERMVATIGTPTDALAVSNAAAVAVSIARRAGLSLEDQNRAATVKLRAERAGGRLLGGLERGEPGRPSNTSSDGDISPYRRALNAAGLGWQDAARWQKLASFTDERFGEALEECRESQKEITTGYILRVWRRENKKHEGEEGPTLRVCGDFSEVLKLGVEFGTIYADPPWQYGNQATRGATGDHYAGMTVDAIAALPVGETVADRAHLHLWTTNAFLFDARRVVEAWGFEYKSCFLWVKPQIGMGNYWRVSHEFLLLGVRGGEVFAERDEPSWREWPRGKHSAKPGKLYPILERVSPGPRLEMFARLRRRGWVSWGDELAQSELFLDGEAA